MGGFVSINGSPDGPPTKAPTWLCDDLGGLHGAIGALAALRHRDRTGEGQHVDVAMLDAMLFQSNGNLTLGAMDLEIKRWGNPSEGSNPSLSTNLQFSQLDGHQENRRSRSGAAVFLF